MAFTGRTEEFVVRTAKSDDEITRARRFHAERYLEQDLIGVMPESGVIDGPWVEHSRFHSAHDPATDAIVGVCRFVFQSDVGLPVFKHLPIAAEWSDALRRGGPAEAYEVGSLASDASHGSLAVSPYLYRETVRILRTDPHRPHMVMAIERRLLKLMRRFLRFPCIEIGQEAFWLGAPVVPVYLHSPTTCLGLIDNAPDSARFFLDTDDLESAREKLLEIDRAYPHVEAPPWTSS